MYGEVMSRPLTSSATTFRYPSQTFLPVEVVVMVTVVAVAAVVVAVVVIVTKD